MPAQAQDADPPDAGVESDASEDDDAGPAIVIPSPAPTPSIARDTPEGEQVPESVAKDVAALKSGDLARMAEALSVSEDRLTDAGSVDVLMGEIKARREGLAASLKTAEADLAALKVVSDRVSQIAEPKRSAGRWLLGARRDVVERKQAQLGLRKALLSDRIFFDGRAVDVLRERADALRREAAIKAAEDAEEAKRREQAKEVEAEARKATDALEEAKRDSADAESKAGQSDNARKISELKKALVPLLEEQERLAKQSLVLEEIKNGLVDRQSIFKTQREGAESRIKTIRENAKYDERVAKANNDAESLYKDLAVCRQQARYWAWTKGELRRSSRAEAEKARSNLSELEDAAKQAAAALKASPKERLLEVEERVARSALDLQRQRIKFYDQEAMLRMRVWQQSVNELSRCKSLQKSVLTLTTQGFRDVIVDINPKNIAGAVLEPVDLSVEIQASIQSMTGAGIERVSWWDRIWGWLTLLVQFALVTGLLILIFRFVRKNRDRFVDGLRDTLEELGITRRRSPWVDRFTDVLRAVLLELVLFILWNLGLSFLETELGQDSLVIVLARALVGSVLIYRIIMGIITTLVMPSDAEVPDDGTLDAEELALEAAAMERVVQRARFIVSTFRLMLLYTIACQYSLFFIRSAIGKFFIGHWLHILGYLGYAFVIYWLLSRWKDYISEQFSRLMGARTPRIVEFVTHNKDRWYGIFVIFVAFVYVLGRELGRWVKRYIFDMDVTRKALNVIFRARIELEQEERAGREGELAVLSDEVRAAFDAVPLNVQLFENLRADCMTKVEDVLDQWRTEGSDGAVAVLSEFGMGKTAMLDRIQARLPETDRVVRRNFKDKITRSEEMIALMAEVFDLEEVPADAAELREAVMAKPRTVVMFDGCHNFYLRRVGGFGAIETFIQLMALTNHHHAYVITFNRFAYWYLRRFKDWGEALAVVEMAPLTEKQLEVYLESTTAEAGFAIDYSKLRVGRVSTEDPALERVRAANNYYRLLHEFSKGNPRVACEYWLRSLMPTDEEKVLSVSVFKAPTAPVVKMGSDFRFILAAIVQHECLSAEELESIVNADKAFCALALDLFREMGVIEMDPKTGRAHMATAYFRQVLLHLRTVNFLYM